MKWPKSKSDLRKSPKSLFTVPSRSVDDIVLAPPPRGPWATFRPRREHIPVQRSFPSRRGACRDQGGANRARAGAERSRKSISRSTENPFPFTRDENRFQFLATSVLQTVISPIFWCLADWSEAPVYRHKLYERTRTCTLLYCYQT
jgi:hypothetical protein